MPAPARTPRPGLLAAIWPWVGVGALIWLAIGLAVAVRLGG
jgi:hypothetical protein